MPVKNKTKLIHLIVGARPNFIKIAPLFRKLSEYPDLYTPLIIHTGQHYDEKLSKLFFDDLQLPQPHAYLHVGSATHGKQTARIMERYEDFLLNNELPDLVTVAGDVNSTIACALVAKKLHIRVAHLEAGLRSYDEKMPEEINRVLTDRISDILLTPSVDADENLLQEGVDRASIFFVGNIMIDSLVEHKNKAQSSLIKEQLGINESERYILITLHRPSNVDEIAGLTVLLNAFAEIGKSTKLVFPVHPRTRKNLNVLGLEDTIKKIPNLLLIEPVGYLDFLKLQMEATLILTDSGGIQEESTYFGIPCLTLRENTERPVTITEGTNQLVELKTESIVRATEEILSGKVKKGRIPKFWDGNTAERIEKVFRAYFA